MHVSDRTLDALTLKLQVVVNLWAVGTHWESRSSERLLIIEPSLGNLSSLAAGNEVAVTSQLPYIIVFNCKIRKSFITF